VRGLLTKIDRFLIFAESALIVFTMLAMVFLIVWQVIARFFLHIPVPYAEDLARLAVVWSIFMGATLSLRLDEHMCVEVIFKHFPKKLQHFAMLLIQLAVGAFALIMVIYGYRYYMFAANDFTTSLGYDRNIFFLPTPLCGALMLIYSLAQAIGSLGRLLGFDGPEEEKEGSA
jgi:TRAP-type C4-dicarboxylate transport system permease small subunit